MVTSVSAFPFWPGSWGTQGISYQDTSWMGSYRLIEFIRFPSLTCWFLIWIWCWHLMGNLWGDLCWSLMLTPGGKFLSHLKRMALTSVERSLNYLSGMVLIPWRKFLNYSSKVMLTPGRKILDDFFQWPLQHLHVSLTFNWTEIIVCLSCWKTVSAQTGVSLWLGSDN